MGKGTLYYFRNVVRYIGRSYHPSSVFSESVRTNAHMYLCTHACMCVYRPMHVPTYVSNEVPTCVIIHIDPTSTSEFISSCKYV